MDMGEHEFSRSLRTKTRPPSSHRAHLPAPDRPAPLAEDPEEQGLTVVHPIVWTAGIAGVVAVLLLSG
jgi:hypothetical protein